MKQLLESLTTSPLFENRRQSQIYLALLKMGPSGITAIRTETGIHAETIQRELKKMQKAETISIKNNGRNKKITASPVAQLQELLEEQKDNFDFILKPLLEAASEEQHVKMNAYIGDHQFALLQVKLMKLQPDGKGTFITSNPGEKWRTAMQMSKKLTLFEKIRLKKNVKPYLLCNEGNRGEVEHNNREYFAGQPKALKREARYVNIVEDSPLTIQIWHSHVIISIFATSPSTHIVFEDKNIRKAMKSYFDILWKVSTP